MGEDRIKTIKLDKIVDAAIKEFAEKGYEKASTEQICRNAGVSKGLLFHHFGTKKGLFFEVYERIISDYIGRINNVSFDEEKSFFENLVRISDMKLGYYSEFPNASTIVFDAAYRTPEEMRGELRAILDKYFNMERFFSEWILKQEHKLRKGIDPKKVWEIIVAVINLIDRKMMSEVSSSSEPGPQYLAGLKNRAEEFLEYYEIIFNGMAARDESASKRGVGV